MDVPRIAIVGAGIGGLSLAGILANELGDRAHITVFERLAENSDQGYGLDLDEYGQVALARAGGFSRYWDFSQPKSDYYGLFALRGAEPMLHIFRPRILQWLLPSLFGARPESNRAGLRQALIDSMAATPCPHEILYGQGVASAEPFVATEGWNCAKLTSAAGEDLGVFDLVVDASGLSSPLRTLRVNDGPICYVGYMFFHGFVSDPAAVFSPELLRRLSTHGTTAVLGRGYRMIFQRFGAGADDKRLCWFHFVDYEHADENSFFEQELGIERPRSRLAGQIRRDDPRRAKLNAWILRDLGPYMEPVWGEAIDKLEYIAVRPAYTHGDQTCMKLEEDVLVPIVLCGDSALHVGLGGGGNLAMRDAVDLANVVVSQWREVEEKRGRNAREALGEGLKAAEKDIFDRRVDMRVKAKSFLTRKSWKRPEDGIDPYIDLWNFFPYFGISWIVPALAWLVECWHGYDKWKYTGVGSTPLSPIYPMVRNCLRKKK